MKYSRSDKLRALKAAFPHTIPIMTGFLFLGVSYGILATLSYGLPWYYPALTSAIVFAGSMEFVSLELATTPFNPINALMMTLMVNARHIFYGLSMLDKYRDAGWRKPGLIFGLCDETFSVNVVAEPPEGVDRTLFMAFITRLDHLYWFVGSTLGGLFGTVLDLQIKGLSFVMTALLLVIFLENWLKERDHTSSLIGLGITALSLIVLGPEHNLFVIPAMLAIIAVLSLIRKPMERKMDVQ